MPVKVRMPELGEGVIEATITRWLKAVGDTIEEYDPLVEVNTDKVDTEIPSPASGTVLKILVEEDTIVNVGQVLAWIGENGEALPEDGSASEEVSANVPAPSLNPKPAPAPVALQNRPSVRIKPGRHDGLGFISPIVAKMATEHGIDLSAIKGTGKNGRITKRDVLGFLETAPVAPPAAPSTVQMPVLQPTAPPPPPPALPGEVMKLSPIRKAIADHMVMSRKTSPHVSTVMDADLSNVIAHRRANKASFARDGAQLTFTAYFVTASIAALKKHPIVNSSWGEDGVHIHRAINIGMATALEQDGLIVPVIKGADGLSLLGIARTVNDLAKRARAKQLKPDEVREGTFTITNHGTSGSLFVCRSSTNPSAQSWASG